MARGLSMRGKQKRHSDCGTTWYGHWWQWVAKEWEELVLSPCRPPGFPREWLVSEEQEKTAGWGGLWRQRKNHHLDLLSPSSSPSFLRPTLPVTLQTHGAFLPQPPARRSLWAFMVQSNRKARDKEGDQALSLLFPPSCSWSQWQTSSRSHIFLRIFFFSGKYSYWEPCSYYFFPPRSGRTTSRSLHQSILFLRHYRTSQGLFWETQLDVAFLAKAHLTLASSPFLELTPSPATKASFFEKMPVGTFLREEPSQEEGSRACLWGSRGRGSPHRAPRPTTPPFHSQVCGDEALPPGLIIACLFSPHRKQGVFKQYSPLWKSCVGPRRRL